MLDWQNTQIEFLKECIYNETKYLYNYINENSDEIYAVSLILDSDALTAYLAVSSIGSLRGKHKKKKWDSEEWVFTITEGGVEPNLDSFTKIIVKRYREELIPKFKNGFNYADEKKSNIEMYTESLKLAKLKLAININQSFDHMIFFINIPGEPKVVKNSAKKINEATELLNDLLNNY